MNVYDYIIDHSTFDWPKLLETWQWRLPARFTAWIVNRFGDLFLQTEDGKIHVLRLDDGSLRCLAHSKDHFSDLIDQSQNANDWLMIPLIDRLRTAGRTLQPGECYGFLQLPIMGGDYVLENIVVRKVARQYAALGPVFEQLEPIPDNTTVEFRFTRQSGNDQGTP